MNGESPKEITVKTGNNKIARFLFFTLIILVVIGCITVFFADKYLTNPNNLQEPKTVSIPQGSSLYSVAKLLQNENIISQPEAFTLLMKILNHHKTIKAGQYMFASNISPNEVFNQMEQGRIIKYSLSIAEGLTTAQIIKMINEAPNMSGAVPEDIKEGELLPETYEYTYNYDRERLIQRMRESMQTAIDEEWQSRAENLPLKYKEEALILASIVEKETGVASERERVAGVFINRLKDGMKLQTDPTVIYAITKGEYVLDRPLLKSDLETDSPYNTYKNFGLPPTPIANPGRKAIHAALNPAITDEYYFVADGTGGHKFSSTLEEHNEGVKQWRKINSDNKTPVPQNQNE